MIGKFCKECGSPLDMNGRCPQCKPPRIVAEPEPREETPSSATSPSPSPSSTFSFRSLMSTIFRFVLSIHCKIKACTGIGLTQAESKNNVFERDTSIVPDQVKPNDGEIPIKQYRVALLRSRVRGQRAEGRLQVTNKRLIFRAAGISRRGPTILQQEFAIEDISGFEVRQDLRFSLANFLWASFLASALNTGALIWFRDYCPGSATVAVVLSVIIGIACGVSFFVIKRHFWLKLCLLHIGIGATMGATPSLANGIIGSFFTTWSVTEICYEALIVLSAINIFLLIFVPNIVITVKNSSGPAVEIRRKYWGVFNRAKENEYTGFSEVIPGEDVDKLVSEIGAMIDDIKTMGDYAIEKWKEEGRRDD